MFVDIWLTQSLLVINEKRRGILVLRTLRLPNMLLNFGILFRIVPKFIESIRIHFHVVKRDRYHSDYSGRKLRVLASAELLRSRFLIRKVRKWENKCCAGGRLHECVARETSANEWQKVENRSTRIHALDMEWIYALVVECRAAQYWLQFWIHRLYWNLLVLVKKFWCK